MKPVLTLFSRPDCSKCPNMKRKLLKLKLKYDFDLIIEDPTKYRIYSVPQIYYKGSLLEVVNHSNQIVGCKGDIPYKILEKAVKRIVGK